MNPHGTVESHREAARRLRLEIASDNEFGKPDAPEQAEARLWKRLEAEQHDLIADELLRLEAVRATREAVEMDGAPEVSRPCNSRSAAAG